MRYFSSIAPEKVLQVAINSSATQIQLNNLTGLPTTYPYTLVIDPDTVSEEIVLVTGVSSGTTLNVSRGSATVDGVIAGDGTAAVSHAIGATVKHMVTARDLQEPQNHIAATTGVHGVTGAVVGTGGEQTLTSKTLTTPTIASFTNAVHNHTNAAGGGTLTSAAITDFTEAAQDSVGALITGGVQNGIAVTYNDSTNTVDFNVNDPVLSIDGDVAGSATMTNLGNTQINVAIQPGVIVNNDVNASAQIAYSKLNLTNAITAADINASAAIPMSKLAVDPTARANHTGTQLASTISNLDATIKSYKVTDLTAPTSSVSVNSQKITNLATPTNGTDAATKAYADLMIPLAQKGANSGVAPLDATGKIPFDHMPASVIADTFVVSSQAAMLALAAGIGDIAVRTDLNKSYILQTTPASTLGNWVELLTPPDAVTSVDGQTGTVVLSGTYATIASDNAKLPLAGGTMSGALNMGTNRITNLGTPAASADAATKGYVDGALIAPSNLTGVITSVGNVTSTGAQTGTGSTFVMKDSPTLTTPNLGVATATSINGTSIPSSKTLVATDSTQYVVPSQTGNAGKYLTTDGTTASWAAVPAPSGDSDQFILANQIFA